MMESRVFWNGPGLNTRNSRLTTATLGSERAMDDRVKRTLCQRDACVRSPVVKWAQCFPAGIFVYMPAIKAAVDHNKNCVAFGSEVAGGELWSMVVATYKIRKTDPLLETKSAT